MKKADNSAERCWMIDALGAIGPAAKAAASVLTEIEKDKHNPDSSQAAARALRRINR